MSSIPSNVRSTQRGDPSRYDDSPSTVSESRERGVVGLSSRGQSSPNQTVGNSWISPSLRSEHPLSREVTPIEIAQQILSATGQMIAATDVEKALSGRASSAAAVAALPAAIQALHELASAFHQSSMADERSSTRTTGIVRSRPRDLEDNSPSSKAQKKEDENSSLAEVSLGDLDEESLDVMASYVGENGDLEFFRRLADMGKMSIKLRETVISAATDSNDPAGELCGQILDECFSLKLNSHEEKLWALEKCIYFALCGHSVSILGRLLKSCEFSLQEREDLFKKTDWEFYYIKGYAPAFISLLTVGLCDQDRFWALKLAVTTIKVEKDSVVVSELLKHYAIEDADREIERVNYGLSDDELVQLLGASRVWRETLHEYCRISPAMDVAGIELEKASQIAAPASETTEEDEDMELESPTERA